jgi:hypothetical protein
VIKTDKSKATYLFKEIESAITRTFWVFIKTVSKLVIIGCFVLICQKKPTELIQVGFTILFIKKQDYSLTQLYHQKHLR